MNVIRASDANVEAIGGNSYEGLATPRNGAQELVFARARKDPGASSLAHSHDREEVVWVISGRALAKVGEEVTELGPGDTLIIPPGLVHQVSTLGDETFECVLAKPAGIRFFLEDGNEMPLPAWME